MQTDTFSSKDKYVINDGWEYSMQYILSFQFKFWSIIVFLQLYIISSLFLHNNTFIFFIILIHEIKISKIYCN